MDNDNTYADIAYDNFLFKTLSATQESVVYEVYPTIKLHPSSFYDEMIYNEKTKFILSCLLGYPIIGIRGFVDYNDVTGIYKMVIEAMIRQNDAIMEDYSEYKSTIIADSFNRRNICGKDIPVSLKYSKLEKDGNIYRDFINNNIIITDIGIVGIDNSVNLSDLYDDLIPRLNVDIEKLVKGDGLISLGFSNMFMINAYPGNGGSYNLNIRVISTLNKIDVYPVMEISTNGIVIDKTIQNNIFSKDIVKEFISYLYNDYLVYIYDIDIRDDINYKNKDYIMIEYDNFIISSEPNHGIMKTVLIDKKIIETDVVEIYRAKSKHNRKIKFVGFMKDGEVPKVKEVLNKYLRFRGLKLKIINMVDGLNSFILVKK